MSEWLNQYKNIHVNVFAFTELNFHQIYSINFCVQYRKELIPFKLTPISLLNMTFLYNRQIEQYK